MSCNFNFQQSNGFGVFYVGFKTKNWATANSTSFDKLYEDLRVNGSGSGLFGLKCGWDTNNASKMQNLKERNVHKAKLFDTVLAPVFQEYLGPLDITDVQNPMFKIYLDLLSDSPKCFEIGWGRNALVTGCPGELYPQEIMRCQLKLAMNEFDNNQDEVYRLAYDTRRYLYEQVYDKTTFPSNTIVSLFKTVYASKAGDIDAWKNASSDPSSLENLKRLAMGGIDDCCSGGNFYGTKALNEKIMSCGLLEPVPQTLNPTPNGCDHKFCLSNGNIKYYKEYCNSLNKFSGKSKSEENSFEGEYACYRWCKLENESINEEDGTDCRDKLMELCQGDPPGLVDAKSETPNNRICPCYSQFNNSEVQKYLQEASEFIDENKNLTVNLEPIQQTDSLTCWFKPCYMNQFDNEYDAYFPQSEKNGCRDLNVQICAQIAINNVDINAGGDVSNIDIEEYQQMNCQQNFGNGNESTGTVQQCHNTNYMRVVNEVRSIDGRRNVDFPLLDKKKKNNYSYQPQFRFFLIISIVSFILSFFTLGLLHKLGLLFY